MLGMPGKRGNPAFVKGNKCAPGGRREGAGAKPKAVVDAIANFRAAIERELGKKEEALVKAYMEFANTDPATARHLVDKAIPAAKQQIEISGGLKVTKVDAFDPDKDGEK